MNCCILLSSCDRNARLAQLTLRLLAQRWLDPPPVWSCGCSGVVSAQQLPLVDDPRDWVGITASAVRSLQKKGYDSCYLILDDHPPVGICHQDHLNYTIPDLLGRLDAACIGLYGWDQRTNSKGVVLGPEFHNIQRQNDDFLWRFSLHPALWQLSALQEVLSLLEPIPDDPGSRSIWAFERRSGAPDFPLSARWSGASYRIEGLRMLGGKRPRLRAISRLLMFRFHDLLRLTTRWVQGGEALLRLDRRLAWQHAFFDGPYPIYWSGVMQKGRLSNEFTTFLAKQHRVEELYEFKKVTKVSGQF